MNDSETVYLNVPTFSEGDIQNILPHGPRYYAIDGYVVMENDGQYHVYGTHHGLF